MLEKKLYKIPTDSLDMDGRLPGRVFRARESLIRQSQRATTLRRIEESRSLLYYISRDTLFIWRFCRALSHLEARTRIILFVVVVEREFVWRWLRHDELIFFFRDDKRDA